jgi:hypothetical protein
MDEILEEALNELNLNSETETPDTINDTSILDQVTVSPEFYAIIEDFVTDIRTTFPEYSPIIEKWWKKDISPEEKEIQCKFVFNHCLRTIPVKIFDILKQNPQMFEGNDTEFLPGIVFKYLWESDITEKTRAVIWKYLQAILNSITNSIKIPGFDNNIFEHFNQEEMGEKLEETMKTVHDMFNTQKNPPEGMEDHFQKMTQGKIGKLAFELAEETAKNLNVDENITSTQDIFSNLLKNPSKMMNIVKNMGSKLEEKMSSGEIDENEIINEGMEMIQRMKDMPGFGDLSKIFGNFENMMPNLSNSQKGQFETKMKQNTKMTKMKERMNKKREKKKDPEIEKIENIKKMLS